MAREGAAAHARIGALLWREKRVNADPEGAGQRWEVIESEPARAGLEA